MYIKMHMNICIYAHTYTYTCLYTCTHSDIHIYIYIYRYQSQVESYQRLKKWYLMPPCLTLSIIRYGSRVK